MGQGTKTKTTLESNLERLNSGWAATSKKERLAIQSIADHIRNSNLTAEEAQAWVKVQVDMLEVAKTLMERHKQHDELWGKEDEAKP